MRRPIVKGIGFSLLAILLLGIAVSVVEAMLQNKAFLWTNAYGVPVGTYSTAAVLAHSALKLMRSHRGGSSWRIPVG